LCWELLIMKKLFPLYILFLFLGGAVAHGGSGYGDRMESESAIPINDRINELKYGNINFENLMLNTEGIWGANTQGALNERELLVPKVLDILNHKQDSSQSKQALEKFIFWVQAGLIPYSVLFPYEEMHQRLYGGYASSDLLEYLVNDFNNGLISEEAFTKRVLQLVGKWTPLDEFIQKLPWPKLSYASAVEFLDVIAKNFEKIGDLNIDAFLKAINSLALEDSKMYGQVKLFEKLAKFFPPKEVVKAALGKLKSTELLPRVFEELVKVCKQRDSQIDDAYYLEELRVFKDSQQPQPQQFVEYPRTSVIETQTDETKPLTSEMQIQTDLTMVDIEKLEKDLSAANEGAKKLIAENSELKLSVQNKIGKLEKTNEHFLSLKEQNLRELQASQEQLKKIKEEYGLVLNKGNQKNVELSQQLEAAQSQVKKSLEQNKNLFEQAEKIKKDVEVSGVQFKERGKEIEKLTSKIKNLEQEIEQNAMQRDLSKVKEGELKQELDSYKQKIDVLDTEKSNYKKQIEVFDVQKAQFDLEILDYKNTIEKISTDLEQKTAELITTQADLANTKLQLQNVSKDLATLKMQNKGQIKDLKAAEVEKSRLEDEVQEVKKWWSGEKEKQKQSSALTEKQKQEQKQNFDKQLGEATARLKKTLDAEKSLQNRNKQLAIECQNLSNDATNKGQKLAELQSSLSNSEQALKQSNTDQSELESKLNEEKRKAEGQAKEVKELSKNIEKIKQLFKVSEAEVASLTKETFNLSSELEAHANEIRGLKGEIKTVQGQLEEEKLKTQQLIEERSKYEGVIKQLENHSQENEKKFKLLAQKAENTKSKIEAIGNVEDVFKEDFRPYITISKQQGKISQLEEKLEKELRNMNDRLDSALTAAKAHEDLASKQQYRLKELEISVKNKDKEITDLKEEPDYQYFLYDEQISHANNQNAALLQENNSLYAELVEERDKYVHLEVAAMQMDGELEEIEKRYNDVKAKLAALKEQIDVAVETDNVAPLRNPLFQLFHHR